MTSYATVLYGFKMENDGFLTDGIHDKCELGMELKQAVAFHLREELGTIIDEKPVKVARFDDHVELLRQETGLWVEPWGEKTCFITMIKMCHVGGEFEPKRIPLNTPGPGTLHELLGAASKAGIDIDVQEPAWFLLSGSE
jgi:hypothetical protein